ncbi:hypothetical protein FHS43_006712 [Streptosporangium becharense]|uniref:Uncharacterized protein n=1 Tax=Streptosporangium becharense TaxID=1816182 RepID=A0A7W9MJX1_9ACTN|nr:hypothetical protein [Streptosporangium becharense]MBB2915392.1 hypothetical protein [Streptosporangium becharense]MBB5823722.1 hypothetical protein [Streptosporangium becharense]
MALHPGELGRLREALALDVADGLDEDDELEPLDRPACAIG